MIFNIGGCSTNWNINNTITPYVHSCWDFHMQYSSLEARGLIISDVSLFWNYHLSPDYRDHFLQRKRMPFFFGGGVLYLQWGPCLPQGPSTNLQELPNLELAMLTPSHQWWPRETWQPFLTEKLHLWYQIWNSWSGWVQQKGNCKGGKELVLMNTGSQRSGPFRSGTLERWFMTWYWQDNNPAGQTLFLCIKGIPRISEATTWPGRKAYLLISLHFSRTTKVLKR